MAIFKCKMCGGTLEITAGTSVIECEYCGVTQTLPKLDDDRRANMYDRANHFRRNNDYDKAMGIFEQILNEDNTDAEAYWSLVLCRYGIEYVEDPATRKRVPTVNRAQFTSIFADEDYKSALQYADGYQRSVYEAEAKAIDEIQKGILAISQKEEPFDVFICYKETDNNGRRTQDSVLANDLYHQLTQEGFKVFFSRITLEDKLGTAYEPYIFAALNSSKVMVVIGTKPEYFNAVWVKNEWSRYLALIRGGAKKILIPAYRDMDPYDLPEEFSHLQAQDMGKLGFMQDLIRGIKKLTQEEAPKTTVVKETVTVNANASTAPLLKRAFMFLEDGEWNSANEYCEKVLDIDPECAEAYIGKLMVDLKIAKRELLQDCAEPFDDDNNYQKALRFADEKLRADLTGYIEHINTRNLNEYLEGVYVEATAKRESATSETQFKEAAALFAKIPDYKDSNEMQTFCLEQAEAVRLEYIYNSACNKLDNESDYKMSISKAVEMFESISGYKDAAEKAEKCRDLVAALEVEEQRKAEEERIKAEKKKKKTKKTIAIVTPLVIIIAALVYFSITVFIPNMKYNDAVSLMDAGQYNEAIDAFEAMDGYKDSRILIRECKYQNATVMMNNGFYQNAINVFEMLNGYKDSAAQIEVCEIEILDDKYDAAVALMNSSDFEGAIVVVTEIIDYRDSAEQIVECNKLSFIANHGQSAYDNWGILKPGDYIYFGSYEQDNNADNGSEEIEWQILDIQDGKILVVSKYALDNLSFNSNSENTTWETCTLRQWLNNDFLNAAFSDTEKAMIPTVTVSAGIHPRYENTLPPINSTLDQMFLLSIAEVEQYFSTENARKCKPTDYALANGAYVGGGYGNCTWWLRSPFDSIHTPSYIGFKGDHWSSNADNHELHGIRPAMWIDLSAID